MPSNSEPLDEEASTGASNDPQQKTPSNNGRRSHAERTDLSDQRMLEAAIELIVKNGTQKTTLKAVGEDAGYSRGLAGYRFGNKAGLFTFVVRAVGEDWIKELTKVTEGKIGFEALSAATDAHMQFCLDDPMPVRAFYTLWYESISADSELKDVIVKIHERRRNDVKRWIERAIAAGQISNAVDADAIAGQFSASIVGIVYQWLAQPEEIELIKQLHIDLKNTMQMLMSAVSTQ